MQLLASHEMLHFLKRILSDESHRSSQFVGSPKKIEQFRVDVVLDDMQCAIAVLPDGVGPVHRESAVLGNEYMLVVYAVVGLERRIVVVAIDADELVAAVQVEDDHLRLQNASAEKPGIDR